MYRLQWSWDLKMCPYQGGVLISEGGISIQISIVLTTLIQACMCVYIIILICTYITLYVCVCVHCYEVSHKHT